MSVDGRETFVFAVLEDERAVDELCAELGAALDEGQGLPKSAIRLRWEFGYGVTEELGFESLQVIAKAAWQTWEIESPGDGAIFLEAKNVEPTRKRLKKLLSDPGAATEAIHRALSIEDDETVEEMLRAAKDERDLDPTENGTTGMRLAVVLLVLKKLLRRAAARGAGVVAFHRRET